MAHRFFTRLSLRTGAALSLWLCAFLSGVAVHGQEKTAEEYARDLESTEARTRREAAYQLSRMGKAARPALPQLIKALEDGQQQVWFGAITALAHLGPDAEPALPALIQELQEWQPFRRDRQGSQALYRTAAALGAIGRAAIPTLSNNLASKEWPVRAGSAMAVGFIGDEARPLIPSLVTLVGDERVEVRDAAAETLGILGEDAVPALVERLDDTQSLTARVGAAEALRRVGRKASAALPLLHKMVSTAPEPELQAAALNALTRIESDLDGLLPVVLRSWREGAEPVQEVAARALLLVRPVGTQLLPAVIQDLNGGKESRARAAMLLAELGPEARSLAPTLVEILRGEAQGNTDPDRGLVRALASMGPRAVSVVLGELTSRDVGSLKSNDWSILVLRNVDTTAIPVLRESLTNAAACVRFGALEGVRSLGPAARWMAKSVLPLLEDSEARIRELTWRAITACGVDAAIVLDKLNQGLEDKSHDVRIATLAAVARLGRDGKTAVPRVLRELESTDGNIRREAIRTIGALGAEAGLAVEPLAQRLSGTSPEEQIEILSALGRIGSGAARALPAMIQLRDTGKAEVRRSMIEALGHLEDKGSNTVSVVIAGLGDPAPSVRAASTVALAALVPEGGQTPAWLIAALDDPEEQVRESAARAITKLEERGRPAEAKLFALLSSGIGREVIVDALRAIHPTSVSSLVEALGHEDWKVREMAVDGLSRLGREAAEAMSALEKAMRDDSREEVRRSARRAVRRVRGQ